jgi:hypothetical protein
MNELCLSDKIPDSAIDRNGECNNRHWSELREGEEFINIYRQQSWAPCWIIGMWHDPTTHGAPHAIAGEILGDEIL